LASEDPARYEILVKEAPSAAGGCQRGMLAAGLRTPFSVEDLIEASP
jgi:hypothetical protein